MKGLGPFVFRQIINKLENVDTNMLDIVYLAVSIKTSISKLVE